MSGNKLTPHQKEIFRAWLNDEQLEYWESGDIWRDYRKSWIPYTQEGMGRMRTKIPKQLTPSLREHYLNEAKEKILKDTQESIAFIKSKGLDCNFEITRDEEEHCYQVASKLWKSDGYYDTPTEFVNLREREAKFRDGLLKGLKNV